MIHFDGEEAFPVPPAELYPKLTDAGFLVHCLPDAEVSAASPDRAAWKLKPKLSFLSGALETELLVTDRVSPVTTRFLIHGKAIGATSTTEAALTFSDAAGGGTAVRWTADITALTGLLKMVPKGLIQATAQKVIADVWAAIRARVAGEGS